MKEKIKNFLIGILVFLLYFKALPIILRVIFGPNFKSSSKMISNIYLSLAEKSAVTWQSTVFTSRSLVPTI